MEILGVSLLLIGLFVGLGVLIGILFGFFGMGGSFLVTPALLVLGYPTSTAVGSGLAFVFGTSIIATLKHRDLGQVDYKLGIMMIAGMTAGIEVGKDLVLYLQSIGLADKVVSVAYVVMLGAVGVSVLYDARKSEQRTTERSGGIADSLQRLQLWPMITLSGGTEVSAVMVVVIGLVVGVLAGVLGVGGGFLLMPAMMYVLGVPAAVAVGTDVFQITISGAFGAFRYAQAGGVDLSVVVPLLAGSAFGARIGSAATSLVDEDGIKSYFGLMLLGGALAVAARQIGNTFHVPVLDTVSFVLIVGSALLVSGAIVVRAVRALDATASDTTAAADGPGEDTAVE